MIVRILTQGQYRLPSSQLDRLNRLDNKIVDAIASGRAESYAKLLAQMLDIVRKQGTPLPMEELVESDVILPAPDTTFQEAKRLFRGEGAIPG